MIVIKENEFVEKKIKLIQQYGSKEMPKEIIEQIKELDQKIYENALSKIQGKPHEKTENKKESIKWSATRKEQEAQVIFNYLFKLSDADYKVIKNIAGRVYRKTV